MESPKNAYKRVIGINPNANPARVSRCGKISSMLRLSPGTRKLKSRSGLILLPLLVVICYKRIARFNFTDSWIKECSVAPVTALFSIFLSLSLFTC